MYINSFNFRFFELSILKDIDGTMIIVSRLKKNRVKIFLQLFIK